jgi:hypothetical protein
VADKTSIPITGRNSAEAGPLYCRAVRQSASKIIGFEKTCWQYLGDPLPRDKYAESLLSRPPRSKIQKQIAPKFATWAPGTCQSVTRWLKFKFCGMCSHTPRSLRARRVALGYGSGGWYA